MYPPLSWYNLNLKSMVPSPQVCIFLELVSGGSIAVMLRKFGAFSEKMIANFTGQVSRLFLTKGYESHLARISGRNVTNHR